MSKWLGIFDKRPLIWFHYVLLTLVLFVAFQMAVNFGIVVSASDLSTLPIEQWVLLFIWYYAFISIGDQLIHFFLGVD